MKSLETKIPPPLVTLSSAFLMWLVGRKTNRRFPRRAGFLPLLAGLGLIASAIFRFGQHKTTADPHHPEKASHLVESGVYRYTRNPMYLGLACILSAWAMALASPLALLGVPGFVVYLSRFQIQPEEKALQDKFGQVYANYQKRVRRWI